MLSDYQTQFIEFLVDTHVLSFGNFVTKSGRETPYFVNTGKFDSGSTISRLGSFYAAHIERIGLTSVSSVFGPAYKGIPLAVATSVALHSEYDCDIGFTFNRKEEKTHGDKGVFVGHQLSAGEDILIVEDVITAGSTLREIVPTLRSLVEIQIRGVVISVDRCEKGSQNISAVQEVERDLDVQVYPLVTIHEILDYLSQPNDSSFSLTKELQERIREYLKRYGAE
ncbi:MAG: orotate phosphoribosyltransferase [Bdellovibrionales bacterium]|nr:orotate phosphoribosyltransferase [Bdellovibrionales bacterium]